MKENWFLLGDIHGETGPIEYFYHQNRDRLKLDECTNYMIFEEKSISEMPNVNTVYVTEGKTFEIIDYIRKNHFDIYIRKL